MAYNKILARYYTLKVLKPGATPTEVIVNGQTSMTMAPSAEVADTSSFDEGGFTSSLKSVQSMALTFDGFVMIDYATGLRDEGQVILEDLINASGIKGLAEFILELNDGEATPTVLEKYEFTAHATGAEFGGANADAGKWGFTLQMCGKPTITKGAIITP